MPYGGCGGKFTLVARGCCIASGTVGYVKGERSTNWGCKAINFAYSQCVPMVDSMMPATKAAVASKAPTPSSAGPPCQARPFGGCGGTHKQHAGCCMPSGTAGYDREAGANERTTNWACRNWKGRSYKQCLPTAASRDIA